MIVLHVDIYSIGMEFSYKSNKHYLIACCDMTTFAVAKPTTNKKSTLLALVLIKEKENWVHFGFSPTIIVDKNSKFYSIFTKTAKCLVLIFM